MPHPRKRRAGSPRSLSILASSAPKRKTAKLSKHSQSRLPRAANQCCGPGGSKVERGPEIMGTKLPQQGRTHQLQRRRVLPTQVERRRKVRVRYWREKWRASNHVRAQRFLAGAPAPGESTASTPPRKYLSMKTLAISGALYTQARSSKNGAHPSRCQEEVRCPCHSSFGRLRIRLCIARA